MLIATLIAADHLSAGDISQALDMLEQAGASDLADSWLEAEESADIRFSGDLAAARAALAAMPAGIDTIVQVEAERGKSLFVADMIRR